MQAMANANNDDECWSRVKGRLRSNVGEDVYSSWFARMDLESVSDGAAHMSVPTRFLKSWIQSHYADRVLSCWQAEMPTLQRVDLSVRTPVRQAALCKDGSKAPAEELRADRNGPRPPNGGRGSVPPTVADSSDALGPSPLDPRLTFGTFLVGRSNTLAHAAARQVAGMRRGDAPMFNPLYVHAGVGLGKTHLLQAIAWMAGAQGCHILYLTAEKFMYGFVSALKNQTALAFKEALRGIDILAIDDLQFLQGKQIQAEFCHTLNALVDSGRQVVVAADRPPADLESLDERVRSRFARRTLNDDPAFRALVPTAENIARVVHDALATAIAERSNARLVRVHVRETRKNSFAYGAPA